MKTNFAVRRVVLNAPSGTPFRLGALVFAAATLSGVARAADSATSGLGAFNADTFVEKYCAGCHNDTDKEANLDLTSLAFKPDEPANLARWIKVYDRVESGEMPPKEKKRPAASDLASFLQALGNSVTAVERAQVAQAGRATQRRLNGYEYENALRDLFAAPWLQIKAQFPEDGEAHRFNKIGDALDVSHVHMSRYIAAADYAMRQVLSVHVDRPKPEVRRYYARDQRTLSAKFTQNPFNSSPDRQTGPLLGFDSQPDVRARRAPATVGPADPVKRDLEAVTWVSSNYVTGFTYRWDQFRAPVAGRYRIKFSGFTMWAAPGGVSRRFANDRDQVGTERPPNPNTPDYDKMSRGHTDEPINVYTRNGVSNRRVGGFDLTPEPGVYDLGEVWLVANETLVPDASRFYRSRPNNFKNPLMTKEGAPAVAFRWMEVEGPLVDAETNAGYALLFGDLPLKKVKKGTPGVAVTYVPRADQRDTTGRNAGQRVDPTTEVTVEVESQNPTADAARLLHTFVARAYRRPTNEADVKRFLALYEDRRSAGLSFAESMLAAYTAVLASPAYVFLDEKPGPLDDHALATRLALFLTNSTPDAALRARADKGELRKPEVLRAETDRLLASANSQRFTDAFLDYWIDIRKIEESTPSTTLYNDYYLDDALSEAALAESQLYFAELLRRDLPARSIADSDFTFLNERLAQHYGINGVKGVAMRAVKLPADSVRGGIMTQAAVLKVTANGTTTSPVLRGKWITERILGVDIPPPPPVAAVEPDIRGAVTIRQQLEKHRADPSCASCHIKMDPPGFALENFDVMGGWRDKYRAADEAKAGVPGLGKNGQPFTFHYGLPVDASGTLPDGRPFQDIRDFKRLLRTEDAMLARNLTRQLLIYSTGAPIRFSDRPEIERILAETKSSNYGVRSLVHAIVQSELFRNK